MTNYPENRHSWLAGLMKIEPSDRILEIGCGGGAAVSIIGEKLHNGTITAIDRSEKMIRRAAALNRKYVEEGKALFQHAELLDIPPDCGPYNKIFASNVNCFWMEAGRELQVIRRLLRDDGTLYVFIQPPSANQIQNIAARLTGNVTEAGFRIQQIVYGDPPHIPGVCVICKPPTYSQSTCS